MESEWKTKDLKDCATWYSGGTPRKENPEYWGGNIPWISAKSLKNFFVSDSEEKITEAGLDNGTRLVPQNSILFIVRGMSLKTEFRMGITTRPVAFNQDLKALVAKEDTLPYFLAYAIRGKTSEILDLVGEAGHGTGVIPTDRIQAIQIPCLALKDQQRIVDFLKALDDKIELNRRMNATLEGMAQALFKSWFVDFDPVIDNALAAGNPIPQELAERAEVRRKALADGTANREAAKQFPAAFQLTEEMGWIPEGWEVKSFETLAKLDTTSVKPFEQPETIWEHYSIPSYDSSGMPSWDKGSEIKSNKYSVKLGAILSSKLNPDTERTWWPFMIDETRSICSTEFMQFVPRKNEEQAFIYSLIRSEPFQANILERVTGSTGSRQRAQPKQIAEIAISDCGELLRTEYIKVVLPLFQSIRNNSIQTQTLINLRDTLLPKLISGELRIPEAESLVEEALA